MQILEGQLVVSATDLVGHLACEHLTALELGVARGEWKRPLHEDAELDLLQKKGAEHEARCLERFQKEGKNIVSLAAELPRTLGDLLDADSRTLEAMRSGAQVIYQGTVFDGRWRGHPDFLVRVDRPSGLGEWSYEPADAKLARRVRAGALLQLCLYAEQLSRLQGLVPEQIAIVTGEGRLPGRSSSNSSRRPEAGARAAWTVRAVSLTVGIGPSATRTLTMSQRVLRGNSGVTTRPELRATP